MKKENCEGCEYYDNGWCNLDDFTIEIKDISECPLDTDD
jgi:hypothetical protein